MAYSSLGCRPTIISHNIKGLNIPEKRSTLLRELKKVCISAGDPFQDTSDPKTYWLLFSPFTTNYISKWKGVPLLVSGKAPLTLTDHMADLEGWYILLKDTYGGSPIMLANVYFPYYAHIIFCQRMTRAIQWFASGCLILGGDFIIPLNPLVDSSSRKSCITYKILKVIKSLLHSLQLIDTWRFLHPEARVFTFHSIPHNRYSCIDYLFISQRDLPKATGAQIEIQSISDHAPISLTVDFNTPRPKSNTWRLIVSLQTDPSSLPQITTSLHDYFKLNDTPEVDPLMIWEAHKCFIRGDLIKLGAHHKKEQEAEIKQLTGKIFQLETRHKQSLTMISATELLEARKTLQLTLEATTKCLLFLKKIIIIMRQVTKQVDFFLEL